MLNYWVSWADPWVSNCAINRWRLRFLNPVDNHDRSILVLPRGGNPQIVQALHRLLQQKGPIIVFLSETKCNAFVINSVKFTLGFDFAFPKDSIGQSGGLGIVER